MNWYKKAQQREFPVAAVVMADDKIFEGRTHGEALQKALDSGFAYKDEYGYIKSKQGNDMSFDGSIDLFRTNKGRIINRFKALLLNEATSSENIPEKELDTLEKIINKYKKIGLDIYVYDTGNTLNLSTLRVPKEQRNQGLGTNFMRELCLYADRVNKDIELNLGEKTPGETTSKQRLINFYKQFGFVRNFGRTKDYTRSCQMYRKSK